MRLIYFLAVFVSIYLPASFAAEMWNAKTPVQVYQEAGSNADSATQSPAPASSESQTVSNKPLMTTPTSYNGAAPPSTSTSLILNEPAVKLIRQELIQMNRNVLMFQQTTNNKIDDIEKQLSTVQMHLKQVAQAFVMLNKDLTALKQDRGLVSFAKSESNPWFPWPMIIAGSIIVVLLVMLIFWLWRRKSPKIKVTTEKAAEKQDDTQDEYDYIGSDEGVAAKLNLARAYIAMEDYAAAKKIIDEVLLNGDEQQRLDAAALAKTLPDQKADE